ncbi:MAG TPA: hypothetical protein VFH44_01535 [Solirubrobacterales bacterium]|nr:hypothetical protein [Solirubrobacterales bacterium]
MSLKKRMIGAGITLIALVAVGLVYAAWTSSGNGSGYAKAGTAQALSTVDVSASTTATLYPGSNGDVLIEIDNPNPYPVRVTSITGNGTITADGGHPGCVTTGVSFTDQTGLTIDIAANDSTQTALSGAASMSNASDNACQGAVFTIPVSLSGNSNA